MKNHSQYSRTLKPDIKLPRDKLGILGSRLGAPQQRKTLNEKTLKKHSHSTNTIVTHSFNRICTQLDSAKAPSTQLRALFKKRSH